MRPWLLGIGILLLSALQYQLLFQEGSDDPESEDEEEEEQRSDDEDGAAANLRYSEFWRAPNRVGKETKTALKLVEKLPKANTSRKTAHERKQDRVKEQIRKVTHKIATPWSYLPPLPTPHNHRDVGQPSKGAVDRPHVLTVTFASPLLLLFSASSKKLRWRINHGV